MAVGFKTLRGKYIIRIMRKDKMKQRRRTSFYSYYLGMDSSLTVFLPEKRGRKPVAVTDRK